MDQEEMNLYKGNQRIFCSYGYGVSEKQKFEKWPQMKRLSHDLLGLSIDPFCQVCCSFDLLVSEDFIEKLDQLIRKKDLHVPVMPVAAKLLRTDSLGH